MLSCQPPASSVNCRRSASGGQPLASEQLCWKAVQVPDPHRIFDCLGCSASLARQAAVFDFCNIREHVVTLGRVVSRSTTEWLGQQAGHPVCTVTTDTNKQEFAAANVAEFIDTRAERSREQVARTGIGKASPFGPFGYRNAPALQQFIERDSACPPLQCSEALSASPSAKIPLAPLRRSLMLHQRHTCATN